MPARVEFLLGDIFEVPCDLLVIPSSAGGTVTPGVAEQIRRAGLPFPDATPWGSINVKDSPNPAYSQIAYAAALQGQRSSPEIVEKLGQALGWIAREGVREISAPLLGSGSGDLAPDVAATALQRGFLATAPDGVVLRVCIRNPDIFVALTREQQGASVTALRDTLQRMRLRHKEETPAGPPPARTAASARQPVARTAISSPTATAQTAVGAPPPVASPSGGAVDPGPAPVSKRTSGRTRVFISYSHEDAEWLTRLQKHLAPLERDGADVWDDTRIKAGAQWREEIREALAKTKVAILLISADFLASPFIVTNELPPLLKAAEEDGAIILPVIISPSRFTRMESLSRFQAVNDPAKPLVQMGRGNRERVLDQVARAVEDALMQ